MSDRTKKFEEEQKQLYVENARLVYFFCKNIGLSKKESLIIAKLALTLENLAYIKENTATLKEFKEMAVAWHMKIEKNRIASMQTYMQE